MSQLIFFPVLIFAVVIHEYAHGIVAKWCGDDTAEREGRITLNPIKHFDLWGTLIIPLILIATNAGILFGWAKPVPVNPNNFRSFKRDDILVSMAGPASNFLLTFLSAIIIIVIALSTPLFPSLNGEFIDYAYMFMVTSIQINVWLAVFNLLPVPPLDGSHVVANLLPDSLGDQYRSLGFMGMFLLVAMMATGVVGAVTNPVNTQILGWVQSFIDAFVS